jgi:23S rRNA-/tRNA-specific pseudouridylate synthase
VRLPQAPRPKPRPKPPPASNHPTVTTTTTTSANTAAEALSRLLGPQPPPFADKHVICINKPPGVLSQPDSSGARTAAEAANDAYGETHIQAVHRLDKLATGCLVLARTPRARTRLAAKFAESSVAKNYLAVVAGRPLRPGDTGLIVASMRRDLQGRVVVGRPTLEELSMPPPPPPPAPQSPSSSHSPPHDETTTGDRRNRAGGGDRGDRSDGGSSSRGRQHRGGARTSLLRWRALASAGNFSLVVASPRGGHKHQVRAMLAHDGLPIVGDPLYGGGSGGGRGGGGASASAVVAARRGGGIGSVREQQQQQPFLALHAVTLRCAHPIAGFAPIRVCARVPRDSWQARVPAALVAAAEEAVARAEVEAPEDCGSPLWAAQPEPQEAIVAAAAAAAAATAAATPRRRRQERARTPSLTVALVSTVQHPIRARTGAELESLFYRY